MYLPNPRAFANTALNLYEGISRKVVPRSLPVNLDIILTKACNLQCIFCVSYGSLKNEASMDFNLYRAIGTTLFPGALNVFICSGGEPFLYPRLREALMLAASYKTRTTITSNGMMITRNVADWVVDDQSLNELCISFDGARKETLEKIRVGASFDTILRHLKYLSDKKMRKSAIFPRIWLRYVIMRSNLEELPEIFRLCSEHGLYKVEVKFLNVTNQIDFSESIHNYRRLAQDVFQEAHLRARQYGIELVIPSFSPKKNRALGCMYPWRFVQIDTDGSIRFCYYSWRQRFGFFEDGFLNIWRGQEYSKLRSTIDSETPFYPYCRFCSEKNGFAYQTSHNQRMHEECYVIPGLEKWQVPFKERAEVNESFRIRTEKKIQKP